MIRLLICRIKSTNVLTFIKVHVRNCFAVKSSTDRPLARQPFQWGMTEGSLTLCHAVLCLACFLVVIVLHTEHAVPFPSTPSCGHALEHEEGGQSVKSRKKKKKKIKVWERAVSYASKRYDQWIKSCLYLGAVSDRRAFIYKWLPLLHPAPAERLNRLRNE